MWILFKLKNRKSIGHWFFIWLWNKLMPLKLFFYTSIYVFVNGELSENVVKIIIFIPTVLPFLLLSAIVAKRVYVHICVEESQSAINHFKCECIARRDKWENEFMQVFSVIKTFIKAECVIILFGQHPVEWWRALRSS